MLPADANQSSCSYVSGQQEIVLVFTASIAAWRVNNFHVGLIFISRLHNIWHSFGVCPYARSFFFFFGDVFSMFTVSKFTAMIGPGWSYYGHKVVAFVEDSSRSGSFYLWKLKFAIVL